MKSILCIIESLGSGGAERQLTGLAVMLKQRGYRVEVCYYVRNEFYLTYLQDNGVETCFLRQASSLRNRFFFLRQHIRTYKPDTVISYSASPSMISCVLKLLGAKYRLIVSERNTTQVLTNRDRFRFFLYNNADIVVPNSQSQGTFINNHYPKLANKVRTITNFVDTNIFSPNAEKQQDKDGKHIICVGRLVPQKNVLLFVEAVAKLKERVPSFFIDWYGYQVDDDYSRQCFSLIKEKGLNDIFTIHPSAKDIVDKYRSSDFFCLPSIYEGYPNVLCEAMSCGLPVVCSNVCDNPYIMIKGETGFLFDPNNIEEIAIALEKMLNCSKEELNRFALNCRNRAVDLFSKDSFLEKYLSIV